MKNISHNISISGCGDLWSNICREIFSIIRKFNIFDTEHGHYCNISNTMHIAIKEICAKYYEII